MLRPKQMSKVSVTGSKQVMEPVVETVHELNLLHVSEYDGSWEGFRQGTPAEEAEGASDKLVTVRSIESILDIEEADAGPTRIVTDDALDEELADVRERVNELDDRRDSLRDELRSVEERLDTMQPFVDLGIDLNLLQGYDTLDVAVGDGDREEVERALLEAQGVDQFEIFEGDDVLAVFVYPSDGAENVLEEALVGVEFAAVEVPETDKAPESYVRELESEKQRLESELSSVDSDLEELKLDFAGFLFAAEEKLSIDVQKAEAPLSFATTQNAFVAEGWIPSERYTEFSSALQDAVGDRVEVEELQRAAFGSDGQVQHRESLAPETPDDRSEYAEEESEETEGEPQRAVADGGGAVVMRNDDPPVVQDNPGIASPFEILVKAVGNPNYREFDPTLILFLTFPAFFGFMIGDLGYGLIYTGIGYFLYSQFDADAFKSLGGVTMTAGLFTMLFGILYGEIFGLHTISSVFWEGMLGMSHPPIEKGLSPETRYWAQAWFLVSALVGILHLNVGYIFQFLEELEFHGFKGALTEAGSWLFALNGIWLFVLSRMGMDAKPAFMYEVFNHGEEAAFALGFAGFPVWAGYLGLAMTAIGFVLLAVGEPVELVEFHTVFVHVLSYLRIAAVLLAKAGMAFAVNLLVFGVFVDSKGGWHFGVTGMPQQTGIEFHHYEVAEIMFGGLLHGGALAAVLGILVLIVGHLIVLILGVTSSGIQAARLEYFEFFSKFYEGNGREYLPFGYERKYTHDD
jgi:V/A-type H+-transporting ATPase subunit I